MNSIIEIEDFLPKSIFNYLKTEIISDYFPWNYNEDVTNSKDYDTNSVVTLEYNNQGFSHKLYDLKYNFKSNYFFNFFPIFLLLQEKFNIESYNNLIRMRLGLLQNLIKPIEYRYNCPHVDYDENHFVTLYYFNDSDGDSIIFNEKLRDNMEDNNFTIKKSITPKENKLVVFNGNHYHASSNPTKSNKRIVLTINFT